MQKKNWHASQRMEETNGLASSSSAKPAASLLSRLVLVCVVILLVTGCASNPPLAKGAPAAGPANKVVYVIDRGWHTDIALPINEISGPLMGIRPNLSAVRYLLFGFGDRHYLLARKITFLNTLASLFPGRSVILITMLRTPPAHAFGRKNVVKLRLSRAGLERITAFLWSYIAKSRAGQPVGLGDGPYPGSFYYASPGTYDAFHTCNSWVAETLASGGLTINSHGVIFADQVMRQARALAALEERVGHAARSTSVRGGTAATCRRGTQRLYSGERPPYSAAEAADCCC